MLIYVYRENYKVSDRDHVKEVPYYIYMAYVFVSCAYMYMYISHDMTTPSYKINLHQNRKSCFNKISVFLIAFLYSLPFVLIGRPV